MTTALIGQRGVTTPKAFVAVVCKNGMQALAGCAARGGHAVQHFADWAQMLTSEIGCWDLVLVDDEMAQGLPAGLTIPAVLVRDGDTGSAPAAAARCLATLPSNAAEGAIGALLDLAVELQLVKRRCRELETLTGTMQSGTAMIGNSPVMRRLHGSLSRAADSDAAVLIEGPTGVGKSLAARIVHCKSRRGAQPPMVVDAATLDAVRFASLLQEAANTTLIVENVERMPATGQAALVRHLKERSTGRGPRAPRLIATSAVHLPEQVARGAFREDLYYRLHTFPILVPSLRERTEDIVPIATAVLATATQSGARQLPTLTPAAVALLESMAWPGNVAQLEAIVRRAAALAGGATVEREHLLAPAVQSPAPVGESTGPSSAQRSHDEPQLTEESIRPFEEEEQELLSRALRATKGNVRRAAQLLGIGRATLYRKIQQYRLRLQ
mgnify:CR=1 FL=1|jgi:DNA-binding NtrC family response regulator